MALIAVETLKRALLMSGPAILKGTVFDHYDANGKEVTGPRLQSQGRGPPDDVHNSGRALDIFVYSRKPPQFLEFFPSEAEIGYGLVNIFLNLQLPMSWDNMIYDQKQWDHNGTVSPRIKDSYDPNNSMDRVNHEHLTHIHIDWSSANAGISGFYDTLVQNLDDAGYS